MRSRKENENRDAEEIRFIAACADAFAHPVRVEIFRYIYSENLNRRRVCNKDLVEEFGYAQATISQHLNKMTLSGLLQAQKEGTRNYYYVNLGLLGKYLNSVRKLNLPPSR